MGALVSMKRWIAAILACALLPALAACSVQTGPALPGKLQQVSIGVAAPLTGADAVYGQGMKNAVQMAIEEVNSSDDARRAGIAFVLSAEDDKSDPKEAVVVANSLVADTKVAAVVGHYNAACSITASAIYNRAGMAMVSVSSIPALTAQGFQAVDRIVPRDDAQGTAAADLLKDKLGITRVATVDDSSIYGEGLTKAFRARFEETSGTVVAAEKIQTKQTDFKALVAKLRSVNPQAIYFGGSQAEGALLSTQAKEAGLKVPLVGGDRLHSDGYIKDVGGAEAEGDVSTGLGLPVDQQPGGAAFIEAYWAKYDKAPQAFDSYAYDAAKMIMTAALQVGSGDREKLASTVRSMSYSGVTGQTAFDANGDTTNQAIASYRVQGGMWVQIR
jgi:branched-chain amino acid transport system substrate-binding protein